MEKLSSSVLAMSLSLIMFMIIGMVNGRRLEVAMISDGVSHKNPTNLLMVVSNSSAPTTTLHAEKRCESIYGFLPCADTMQEGVFLMITYTYLMMLGEEYIHKGSHALFLLLGDQAIGASVFRVLMALPRIVIVLVSGVLATASDAENQVAFSVSMFAGSTVITLTLIWGMRIILSRDKLRGKGSTKGKLSILTDTGVNIDQETGKIAETMLLSLIPFATVALVVLFKSRFTILLALMVSSVSLFSNFAYQIWSPLIQARGLAYLKQEHLQTQLFYHIQMLADGELLDDHGKPNINVFKSIFTKADVDNDNSISHDELEDLIHKVFELEKDQISKVYAKAEILTHFDSDQSGQIDWTEFIKGCTKWIEKWKNVPNTSDSVSKHLWDQVLKVAAKNKRANLTKIEKIMPRILKHIHEQHELVTQDGKADRENIEGLFSKYDENSDC